MSAKYIVIVLKDNMPDDPEYQYDNIADFTRDFEAPSGYTLDYCHMADGIIISHETINNKIATIEMRGLSVTDITKKDDNINTSLNKVSDLFKPKKYGSLLNAKRQLRLV